MDEEALDVLETVSDQPLNNEPVAEAAPAGGSISRDDDVPANVKSYTSSEKSNANIAAKDNGVKGPTRSLRSSFKGSRASMSEQHSGSLNKLDIFENDVPPNQRELEVQNAKAYLLKTSTTSNLNL